MTRIPQVQSSHMPESTLEIDRETSLRVADVNNFFKLDTSGQRRGTMDLNHGNLRLPDDPASVDSNEGQRAKLNLRETLILKSILRKLLSDPNPEALSSNEITGNIKLACIEMNQEACQRREEAQKYHSTATMNCV